MIPFAVDCYGCAKHYISFYIRYSTGSADLPAILCRGDLQSDCSGADQPGCRSVTTLMTISFCDPRHAHERQGSTVPHPQRWQPVSARRTASRLVGTRVVAWARYAPLEVFHLVAIGPGDIVVSQPPPLHLFVCGAVRSPRYYSSYCEHATT